MEDEKKRRDLTDLS